MAQTAVFGRTVSGERVRIIAPTEATREFGPGWEIAVGRERGLWVLDWLPADQIVGNLTLREEEPEDDLLEPILLAA